MPATPPNRLRFFRGHAGWTLAQVAEIVHRDESTVSRWETGELNIPDEAKQALASAFRVSVAHLMRWDDGDDGNGNGDSERRAA